MLLFKGKRWQSTAELFANYREWEPDNFPGRNTSIDSFGSQLSSLIRNFPDCRWEKNPTPPYGIRAQYKVSS